MSIRPGLMAAALGVAAMVGVAAAPAQAQRFHRGGGHHAVYRGHFGGAHDRGGRFTPWHPAAHYRRTHDAYYGRSYAYRGYPHYYRTGYYRRGYYGGGWYPGALATGLLFGTAAALTGAYPYYDYPAYPYGYAEPYYPATTVYYGTAPYYAYGYPAYAYPHVAWARPYHYWRRRRVTVYRARPVYRPPYYAAHRRYVHYVRR